MGNIFLRTKYAQETASSRVQRGLWVRSQLRYRTRPILFGRAVGTPSGLPQSMSQSRYFLVTEGNKPGLVQLLRKQVSFPRMFQRLTGDLVARLAILFVVALRRRAVCVGRDVVQLSGSLMILVMRSIVVTCGH